MTAAATSLPLTPDDDTAILTLWRAVRDTLEIARRLGRTEAEIANRLAQLRDEDGGAMSPAQYAVHHARKQRLARFNAAAVRAQAAAPPIAPPAPAVKPAAKPDEIAAARMKAWVARQQQLHATLQPAAPRVDARHVDAPDLDHPGGKPPWFCIEGETDASAGPSVRTIQQAVCEYYGVTLRDLLSPRRHLEVVRPRQIAVYLSRELTTLSMTKIGDLFSRDHTTILASRRKIEALLATDAQLVTDVAELTERLR
jgi:DnaA-like protein